MNAEGKKRGFKRELIYIALPIILQNLLSAAVGSADTLMLNYVGQNEMAAVSLANQPQFVLNLFYMGLTSGTGIMMAQYLGSGDREAAGSIFRLALRLTAVISSAFAICTVCLPQMVMRIFTNDGSLIDIGSQYLRIVGITYLFMAFSQIYLVTLKTNRRVKSSSAFSICTLLINVFLNAVFIFGLFSLPQLGVTGVAIATLIARFAEMVFCLIDWKRSRLVSIRSAAHPGLGREYLKVTCPAMGQGFVWGGAMATLAAIMGHLGPEVVAANSIASAIQNAATVASFGLPEGGAILLGNLMGKGKLAEAKTDAAILLRISVGAG